MATRKSLLISSILVVMDIAIVYGVFSFSGFIRDLLSTALHRMPVDWSSVNSMTQLGIIFVITMFFIQRLYPGYGLTAIKELESMIQSITYSFVLLAMISYLVKSYQVFPRSIIPLAWILCIVILPITRLIERNLLSRTSLYGVPAIVFGEGEWANEVVSSLKRVRRLGWRPCELLSLNQIQMRKKYSSSSIAVLAATMEDSLQDQVRILNQHFKKVILLQKAENLGSLWVETRDMDSNLGLEFHFHLLDIRNIWIKRATDIIGAVLLLIILSPILLLLSVLVALDSPGPAVFRQQRLGKGFQKFDVFKFRTMSIDAEEKLVELLQNDPKLRAEYEEFHKLEHDPRITKIGRILRKYSLDELPQLWNVLKGEMSLSGPRAYMPSELENIGSFAAMIFRVRPGITGWWQVLGRHQTSFQKRLQMDEYYISNWSLWMDAYITIRTIYVIIKGKGA